MEKQTIQQLRGLSDLLSEAVEATTISLADVHQEIAHQPSALLAHITPIAAPVRCLEQTQQTITANCYGSVRLVNRIVKVTTTCIFDQWERCSTEGESTP
jgi:hypothetical protein